MPYFKTAQGEHISESSISELSEGAQQLVRLCGRKGPVAEVLAENPGLIENLDEYLTWRTQESERVDGKQSAPAFSHSFQQLVDSLTLPV